MMIQVLLDMFSEEEEDVLAPPVDEPITGESPKYEDIVKDFILEETQYMRDLNMIIKVFRAPFAKHFPRSKDLEVIFSNILEVYEFTAMMLASVEEQVELAEENRVPSVGICFQDMAEVMGRVHARTHGHIRTHSHMHARTHARTHTQARSHTHAEENKVPSVGICFQVMA
jgi:hypothetical protein